MNEALNAPTCLAVLCVLGLAAASSQQSTVREFRLDAVLVESFGRISADGSSEFAKVVGAFARADESVVIADGYAKSVRVFGETGGLERTVGREGAGPGEFRDLSWMGPCGRDEFATYDVVLNRVVVFDSNDHVVGSRVLPASLIFARPLLCTSHHHVIVVRDQPAMMPPRSMVVRYPATVLEIDLVSGSVDTLGNVPGNEYYFANEVGGFGDLPGGGYLHAAAAAGVVALAPSDEPKVRVWPVSARKWTLIENGTLGHAPSAQEFAAAVDARVAEEPKPRTRELLKRVYAGAPRPRTIGNLTDLAVDQDGLIWIKAPQDIRDVGEADWNIVDIQGRRVGHTRLPSRARPIWISRSRILLAERDSIGTQVVSLHSLVR